jgi:septin family protein
MSLVGRTESEETNMSTETQVVEATRKYLQVEEYVKNERKALSEQLEEAKKELEKVLGELNQGELF